MLPWWSTVPSRFTIPYFVFVPPMSIPMVRSVMSQELYRKNLCYSDQLFVKTRVLRNDRRIGIENDLVVLNANHHVVFAIQQALYRGNTHLAGEHPVEISRCAASLQMPENRHFDIE